VDIELLTFLGIDWWKVKTSEDLVEARSEQLLRRESLIEKAAKRLKDSRAKSVRYWDRRCASRLREALRKGDLVLLYNRSLESQWGKLFSNRWNGPYRVVSQFPGGSYQLEELDGTLLKRRAAAAHVKRFYARGSTSFDEAVDTDDKEEVVRMPKRRSDSEDGSVAAKDSGDDASAADTESESTSEEDEEASEQPEPDPPQPRRSKRLRGTAGDSGRGLGRRGGLSGGR
jgi:hypothetical protein